MALKFLVYVCGVYLSFSVCSVSVLCCVVLSHQLRSIHVLNHLRLKKNNFCGHSMSSKFKMYAMPLNSRVKYRYMVLLLDLLVISTIFLEVGEGLCIMIWTFSFSENVSILCRQQLLYTSNDFTYNGRLWSITLKTLCKI